MDSLHCSVTLRQASMLTYHSPLLTSAVSVSAGLLSPVAFELTDLMVTSPVAEVSKASFFMTFVI